MFILSLTIPGVNYRWTHLQGLLNRYGDFLSSGAVDGISVAGVHFPASENSLDIHYCPLEGNYVIAIELAKNGIGSSTSLNPFDQTGKIDLRPRTRVILENDIAEITNPQFEDIAILHLRMLITVLKQTEKESFTKMLKALEELNRR